MIIKTMDKKEIKQLLKSKPVDGSFNVFKENDGIIKIYKDPMFELERYATVIFPGSLVQEEQIYWLESKQPFVKGSNLPMVLYIMKDFQLELCIQSILKDIKTFTIYTKRV
jgi:hypothetical protein